MSHKIELFSNKNDNRKNTYWWIECQAWDFIFY